MFFAAFAYNMRGGDKHELQRLQRFKGPCVASADQRKGDRAASESWYAVPEHGHHCKLLQAYRRQ